MKHLSLKAQVKQYLKKEKLAKVRNRRSMMLLAMSQHTRMFNRFPIYWKFSNQESYFFLKRL